MALVKLGAMVAAVSGSIGGVTFGRNRGGQYVRNRTPPLNPNSPRQATVRALLADLSNKWSTLLTDVQRTAWDNYAANVPINNALGEPRNVTGLNMYVRGNSMLLQTGGVRVDDGPTNLTQGPTYIPTMSLTVAGQDLTIDAIPGSDIVNENVGMLTQMGVPQQAGVNFFKNPFQLADGRQLTLAPDVPFTIDPLPFPFVAGQAVFIRTRFVTVDGRVGNSNIARFLAA